MRIAYLGWGDHVHLERWAGWFVGAGHEVHILSLSGKGRYPAGVLQYDLRPFAASWRMQLLALRALLFRISPDLVHVHWAGFGPMVVGRWQGPIVITAWGSDIYRLDQSAGRQSDAIAASLRGASLVTVDSEDLARRVEGLADKPAGTVEVVQWGVDTESFTPGVPFRPLARDAGLRRPFTILSPRSFTPLYNIDVVVRAFARVCEARDDVDLLMKCYAFDVDYRAQVEALIESLGLGDRVGIVEKIPYEQMVDFYRSGPVIVSIPDSDGTPMSLLEGMACGCVPIASDLPSLREWITDGVNGFLVEPRDEEAVANALLTVLADEDRRRSMRESNLTLVRERASHRGNMELAERLCQGIVETERAPFSGRRPS